LTGKFAEPLRRALPWKAIVTRLHAQECQMKRHSRLPDAPREPMLKRALNVDNQSWEWHRKPGPPS
jgi:hypothetical protein